MINTFGRIFLFAALLLVISCLSAAEWFINGGGAGFEQGKAIAKDGAGNVYVAGYFEGTAVFGATSLTSSGADDIYVAKLNPGGNWLWAKRAGSDAQDVCNGIAVDNSGNVIITGNFYNTAGFGTYSVTSSGLQDAYVAKLDTNGNWLWASRAGGVQDDFGSGITTDATGNCYVTGTFLNVADFGTTSLTSGGFRDAFVAKLNMNGTWQWAVRGSGTNEETGTGITWSNSYGLFVTGSFFSDLTFGSLTISPIGAKDIYVCHLDGDGNCLWLTGAGGAANDAGYSITSDSSGRVFVAGYFCGTAYFNGTILSSNGTGDIFAAGLDADGGWIWATRAGGSGFDTAMGISTDGYGFTYVTGYYQGRSYFANQALQGFGSADVFTAKLNGNGTWLWARGTGSSQTDYGYGVAALTDGSCLSVGSFYDAITFDETQLFSSGGTDVYIAKIADPVPEVPDYLDIYPNENDVTIVWSEVDSDTWDEDLNPDYYFVYYNTLGSGATFQYLTYVHGFMDTYVHQHAGFFSFNHFYRVTAVKLFDNSRSAPDTETWLQANLRMGMTEEEVKTKLQELQNRHN